MNVIELDVIDATQTCEHPPESIHAFWITAVDIIGAPQRNPSDCPVARALNRITGVTWILDRKSAWNTTSHQIYKMSPDLCWYIQRFDQGGSMDEQYFEWALIPWGGCRELQVTKMLINKGVYALIGQKW